jgi:two-component system LytT family response regulator
MPSIRAVIVDDEPLGREALRELLAHEADVDLVGEYCNGSSFLAALPHMSADLVFLDVEMPRLSGLDIVREAGIGGEGSPFVIFVTAFNQYAVRAFDAEAIDYLLKPYEPERLAKALDRVRRRLPETEPAKGAAHPAPPWLTRFAIKAPGRIRLLHVNDLDWLEAAGNYVRLHVGRTSCLFRTTMAALETRIDPSRFVRIHRTTIVNVDRIVELQALGREHVALLHDGTRLRLGAPYRDRLREMVEGL